MEKAAWWLGWHPKFPFAAVGDWIAAQPDAELIARRKLPPLRLFTLLVIGKRASAP
jgi:phosphatidylethanolamine/phosphatidyl-N-methylethanolamine N-methyltransferase